MLLSWPGLSHIFVVGRVALLCRGLNGLCSCNAYPLFLRFGICGATMRLPKLAFMVQNICATVRRISFRVLTLSLALAMTTEWSDALAENTARREYSGWYPHRPMAPNTYHRRSY
jgi:hypothetical protein